MSERIRPPYRWQDDIPFKAKGWRVLAAMVVGFVGLAALVLLVFWLRWVFRGMDEVLINLVLLFGVIMAPLVFVVMHYVKSDR